MQTLLMDSPDAKESAEVPKTPVVLSSIVEGDQLVVVDCDGLVWSQRLIRDDAVGDCAWEKASKKDGVEWIEPKLHRYLKQVSECVTLQPAQTQSAVHQSYSFCFNERGRMTTPPAHQNAG